MAPPRLFVLDIPHIVDAVCDHLDSKDIWNCYRVARAWRLLFGPYRYRNVRFADLDSDQTWHILDNAHRIRNLTVDLADATYLLSSDSSCTRLRHLSCIDMGYMAWPVKEEEDEWFWEYTPTMVQLEPQANALSLISRNPRLEYLKVHHIAYGVHVDPFTPSTLAALSYHPSLTRIYINIQLYLKTAMALFAHLPRTLQDLELDLEMYYDHEEVDTTPSLVLTRPTRIRRFVYRESMINFESMFLLPLLRQCPQLEQVHMGAVAESRFGDVMTVLYDHCPHLESFTHEFRNSDLIRTINTMLDSYPNGLRTVNLTSSWYYTVDSSPTTVEADTGALIKAILKYSANTIEVISLTGQMRHWIKGIKDVLEQCPNLKELHVYGDYIHLDEIVTQTKWETRSIWDTPLSASPSSSAKSAKSASPSKPASSSSSSSSASSSSLTLPWVCKKLESLSLFIYKPQSTSVDFNTHSHERDQDTNDLIEELALSTVLQVGILWKTLKTLPRLKTLSLNWDQPVYQTIGTMPFDRGVYYMDQIGLTGITQAELEWMGVQWEAISERLKSEEAAKLTLAALEDQRTGCDSSRVEEQLQCRCPTTAANTTAATSTLIRSYYMRRSWDREEDDEEDEVDWPYLVDRKKFSKSGQLFSRRSVRNGADWFRSRARS